MTQLAGLRECHRTAVTLFKLDMGHLVPRDEVESAVVTLRKIKASGGVTRGLFGQKRYPVSLEALDVILETLEAGLTSLRG